MYAVEIFLIFSKKHVLTWIRRFIDISKNKYIIFYHNFDPNVFNKNALRKNTGLILHLRFSNPLHPILQNYYTYILYTTLIHNNDRIFNFLVQQCHGYTFSLFKSDRAGYDVRRQCKSIAICIRYFTSYSSKYKWCNKMHINKFHI